MIPESKFRRFWSERLFRRVSAWSLYNGDLVYFKAAAYPKVVVGPYRVKGIQTTPPGCIFVEIVGMESGGVFTRSWMSAMVPIFREADRV